MKQRLQQIMANGQNPIAESPHQAAIQQPTPQPVRQPSLMDHVIALRQEVAMLSQQVQASGQVTEAVGQAVGQLYVMFQPTAQGNAQGASYSENFQQSVDETDY